MSAKKTPSVKKAAKKAPAKKTATKAASKKAAPAKKKASVEAKIAAAIASINLIPKNAATVAASGGPAKSATTARSYPAVLPFLVAYCSACEGRPVAPDEVLNTLRNVRRQDLNAAINDTYHIPAGVARYPFNRPNMALMVAGAAVDVRGDLISKGVVVPLQ